MTICRSTHVLVLLVSVFGCSEPATEFPPYREPLPDPEMPADAEASARVVHGVAPFELEGSEETMTCYSWTVDNDAPLYVQALDFQNGGSFHHSNWFVVPEDLYSGGDGFWPCAERGFEDVPAALAGTVLFAQSTQAQQESMAFADGATIRIPARSKIVAGVHLLNLGPDSRETAAWLSMDIIHPALVETILSPIMLTYGALSIPPKSRSIFTAACTGEGFEAVDAFELHYILPHYHRAGASANVIAYDAGMGTEVLNHTGFGAVPMGRTFDPPIALDELGAIEFSCGYDNPHDETLTWGIGINEMCVFLGFANTSHVLVASVFEGYAGTPFQDDEGTFFHSGRCRTAAVPKGIAYDPPTREEIGGPLVLPNSDDPSPEPPSCEDIDAGNDYASTPTFSEIQARVFQPWCSFSSCHGTAGAGGLVLNDEGALDALVGVRSAAVDMPRVAPGDPEGSYLMRLLSECEPEVQGTTARHMPIGAPTLLDPALVDLVWAWIEMGASV
ncbi:MAG: hypothetical protein KUG77_12950 [Nannocystaceae bacterium]|nr:hypothetical protein [Nannocystaceae bacterium]